MSVLILILIFNIHAKFSKSLVLTGIGHSNLATRDSANTQFITVVSIFIFCKGSFGSADFHVWPLFVIDNGKHSLSPPPLLTT
jgi:hypothetical protein